jgi:hypothetical protein
MHQIDTDTLLETLYGSNLFIGNEQYYDYYFGKESLFNYESAINIRLYDNLTERQATKISICQQIYDELLKLGGKYYRLLAIFRKLQNHKNCNRETKKKAEALKACARKHHLIFNYVDAVKMLKRANELLRNS